MTWCREKKDGTRRLKMVDGGPKKKTIIGVG